MKKPAAFIIDIDGTVSDHGGLRGHYEYEKVSTDLPKMPIIKTVKMLAAQWKPIFVTGRMDGNNGQVRSDTIRWISRNIWPLDPMNYNLHMREDKDYRPDDVVKEEIYLRDIEPRWDIQIVLDDRDRVVAMWRQQGLTCLQVAEGNF